MKYSKESHYKELIHSKEWSQLRTRYIKEHPLCERCHNRLATEIHHIEPLNLFRNNIQLMYNKAFDTDNLQALCHQCHNEIHIELEKNKHADPQGHNKEKVNDFLTGWLDIKETE